MNLESFKQALSAMAAVEKEASPMLRQPDSPTTASWTTILDLCRSRLSQEDFNQVCKQESLEDLIKYGKDLQDRYAQMAHSYELARLSGFFQQLKTFNTTFDVLVHIQPTMAAPLWGSLRLCIELVNQTDEVFQMIIEMFDEISSTLPRIGVFIEILPNCNTLMGLCYEVNILVAEFACQVIVYFRRNPLKNLLGATWKPFRNDFSKIISKIRQTTRRIELEAQTLSMQQSVSRHEEIKRLLAAKTVQSLVRLPCQYVQYPRNAKFAGREGILEDMHAHLANSSQEQRVYSLFGLGGVGKTQITLEYLYRYAEEYSAIFCISADTIIKLGQDIRGSIVRLGLINEDSKFSDQQCRTTFLNWLQETEESWLLVFDNADDLKTLQGCWPVSKHGGILLTSRDPGAARFPSNGPTTKGHQVLSLPSEEGVELLLGLVDQDLDSPDNSRLLAQTLVNQLGGLPLAINQMASFMVVSGCGLEDFLEMFSDCRDREQLISEDSTDTNISYPHSLQTVWEMSMSRISKANADSAHILQIMALYDPDSIPERLLLGSKSQGNGNAEFSRLKYLESKLKFFNATKPLLQQSLVMKDQAQQAFSMHRLVGAITLSKIETGEKQARFDEALELLYRVYPRLTLKKALLNDAWPSCRLYLPHVVSLERYYRESESPLLPRAKFATVLANASWFLFEQGLPSQALQILPTARQVGEATLSGNEEAVATIYRAYGAIYLDANKPQEAFDNFSRQLNILQNIGSPDDLVVAHGYNNVALAQVALGQYESAKTNYQRAIDIRNKYPGEGEGYKALTLLNMATLEGLRHEYEKALPKFREAIELFDRDQGVGNYMTASSYFGMGNALVREGKLNDAYDAHSLCLSIRRDAIGDTYRTAAALHKVAWHLHQRDDNSGAEELLLKALAIYTNAYEGRGGLGRSSYLMAQVLSSLGRDEDAQNTKTLAGAIRKEILGIDPDDDDNLDSYDNLVGFLDR